MTGLKAFLDLPQGMARRWRALSDAMWTYYPDLLERPVPRYTSYPTAAEFTGVVGMAQQELALDSIEQGTSVSLYVHIPFCEEICWYCGCNTARSNRTQRLSAYLDALADEIDTVADRIQGRVHVDRIAFGGGSPNAIAPVDFVRLLDRLLVSFRANDARISVELDPRGFNEEWALALGKSGVSHVSLGVQTFDPEVQRRIGRLQPVALIEGTLDALRQHGVSSINFDLMYGLPGQGIESLDQTLSRVVALGPERVALFGYAHVPHMLPRQRRIDATDLPGQKLRFEMAELGYRRFTDAGYRPVGFDHFALSGDGLAQAALGGRLRRNFQGFTDDQSGILIGFGTSAISMFPGMLIQNEKNSGRYRMLAKARRLAGVKGVLRSAEDRAHGAVIEALLCAGHANLHGISPANRPVGRLVPFVERGLARLEDGFLSITPRGLPYARTIAALFDIYREEEQSRFSSAI